MIFWINSPQQLPNTIPQKPEMISQHMTIIHVSYLKNQEVEQKWNLHTMHLKKSQNKRL